MHNDPGVSDFGASPGEHKLTLGKPRGCTDVHYTWLSLAKRKKTLQQSPRLPPRLSRAPNLGRVRTTSTT